MKTIKLFNRYILLLLTIAGISAFSSCKDDDDDDDDGGQPEIHYVRLTNPAKADSTFTNAFPGQMLAIIGKNLSGIQKIFINNQEVSFNANYGTSTNIIVSVPNDIKLKGTNPDLPDEIRIETSHGIATYAFHIYSPAPLVNRLAYKYPATAGAKMVVYGDNFYEIQKVVFEGGTGMNVDVAEYAVSEDYKSILFNIPAGIEDGRLAVYCYTDSTSIEFFMNLPPPTIKKISSDMPVIGDLAYIVGDYYVDVTNLNINGEFDIPAEELVISASNDTIYFRLPQAPTKSGVITITATGGNSSSTKVFYPIGNVMLNFNGIGWYSWGDHTESVTADGSKPPYISSGVCYRIFGPQTDPWWWGNMVSSCAFPSSSVIPDDTPVGNLRVRFECYMAQPVAPAFFNMRLTNENRWLENYVPVDMNTGSSVTGKWITCEFSLSAFTTATSYSAFAASGDKDLWICTKGDPAHLSEMVDIYFDNFRIIDITR